MRKKNNSIGGKVVNVKSLEVNGVDSSDYPDFADAYLEHGEFEDGTKMSDDDLKKFGDKYSELVHTLAHGSLK